MEQKQIEFMHFRPQTGNGGATVAILPGSGELCNVIVSVARCGPEDNFNKKIGRAVAGGRIKAYLNGNSNVDRFIETFDVINHDNLKSNVAAKLRRKMKSYGLIG